MDAIIQQLKDPGWWFTAVFVGIVGSIIAGFCQNRISAWAARYSVAAKERRQRKLKEAEERIRFLVENPDLLGMHITWAIGRAVLFVAIICLWYLNGIWIDVLELTSSNLTERWFLYLGFVFYGAVAAAMGYKSARGLDVPLTARLRLTAKRRDAMPAASHPSDESSI